MMILWKRERNLNTKPFYLIKDKDAGLKVKQKLTKLVKQIKLNKQHHLICCLRCYTQKN